MDLHEPKVARQLRGKGSTFTFRGMRFTRSSYTEDREPSSLEAIVVDPKISYATARPGLNDPANYRFELGKDLLPRPMPEVQSRLESMGVQFGALVGRSHIQARMPQGWCLVQANPRKIMATEYFMCDAKGQVRAHVHEDCAMWSEVHKIELFPRS